MINPESLIRAFIEHDVGFFTGVPDSLLKEFCTALEHAVGGQRHITATNEGCAIGLAAGYYLATGKPGLVYMQNSGLGNAINPLLSLADPAVYGLPMVILVGWRGEPGAKDEPQHIKQGAVQEDLLDTLGFPHILLSAEQEDAEKQVIDALGLMLARSSPVIIVVRKSTFCTADVKRDQTEHDTEAAKKLKSLEVDQNALMTREEALKEIAKSVALGDKVISTTGMASREIYEIRESNGQSHDQDFLTVGSMGHCSAIALSFALFSHDEERRVWCLDGDGAALMHLGTMALIGNRLPRNLLHVILNNGAHDSVGGQATIGYETNFTQLAITFGYKRAYTVSSVTELRKVLVELERIKDGLSLLEIRIRKGARPDLGRPKTSPKENLLQFMGLA